MDLMSDVGSVSIKRHREMIFLYWRITGYLFCPRNPNDEWHSPMFKELNGTWCFVLHPNKSNFVSLYIKSCEAPNPAEGLVYTAGIQNGDGTIYIYSEPQTVSGSIFGKQNLLNSDIISNQRNVIAPEGHVTFFMTISLRNSKSLSNSTSDSISETCIDEEKTNDEGLIILSRNLRNFFAKKDECDVVFKVSGKEYPAHKSIIAARSPVFACMFKHDMSEKNSGIVNIVDTSPEAFHALLIYLYSGQVDEFSSETAVGLYDASSKYELEHLKTKCKNFITKNINTETFCDFMLLGLKHEDVELIKCATDYFITHAKEIMLTAKWQLFLKENSVCGNELYLKVLDLNET